MSRARTLLWMVAGLAALAAIGAYTAKPLLAQIKAALVENIDEPGRNPYSSTVDVTPFACNSSPACVLQFAAVPAGKRLVVTSITGVVYPSTPGVVWFLALFPSAGTAKAIMIPTFLEAGTVGNDNIVGINAQLNTFFEGGSTPVMSLAATTSFLNHEGAITLSGYLVSLP